MQPSDKTPGVSGADQAAQTRGIAGSMRPGKKADGRPGVQHVRRAAEWGQEKYTGSWAEYLWRRLDAVDFMNQAMLLAATLLLCAVPFLLVAAALAGRSAVSGLTVRLGLDQQAAANVGHLVTSSSATSNAVTGLSWVFFILAGIAAATAVQQLYQRVFGQDSRGLPDRLRAVIWLGMLAVFSVIFSGMVISYDQKYGPIGVVFGLMSFFIAVGVVIILGAAVGLMWQDRGLSFRAAVGKLRRAS